MPIDKLLIVCYAYGTERKAVCKMTFRQMEHLVEVADQGSISVAARKLMISQPSLSQSIKSIEKEYNVTLFDRSSVPLTPTKAGAVFLNKAHIMLTVMEDLKKELSALESTPQELHIGISDSASLINKRIFREFQSYYPDVKLVLVERDQYLLERLLEAGKLDMMFTMTPYDNPNLDVLPLVEDEMLIALPQSHPVSRRCMQENPGMMEEGGKQRAFPVIDLSLCKDVRFVLSGRDRLKFAQMAALRTAFEPVLGFETDTLASSVAIAAYEPHGAVVPRLFSVLYDGPERPCFFRSSEKLPMWGFALSLQKGRHLSAAAQRYIKLFVRYIQNLGMLSDTKRVQKYIDTLHKTAK